MLCCSFILHRLVLSLSISTLRTSSLIRIFRQHGLRRLCWIKTVYQQFHGCPEVVRELLNWLTFVEACQQSAAWLATKLVAHLRESKPHVLSHLRKLGFQCGRLIVPRMGVRRDRG